MKHPFSPSRSVLAVTAFLIFLSAGFSQTWNKKPYLTTTNPKPTLQEYKAAFERWKQDEAIEAKQQELGKKLSSRGITIREFAEKETFHFERWLYWAERHLMPDGTLPPADQNFAAWQAYRDQHLEAANARGSNANWTSLGPNGYAARKNPAEIDEYQLGVGRLNCIAFHPADSLIMWAGSPSGGIWKTVDGGENWFAVGENVLTNRISDITVQSSNPNVLYACTGDIDASGLNIEPTERPTAYGVGILRSTDGGISWAPTGLFTPDYDSTGSPNSPFRRLYISPLDANELLAVGLSGMYKSTNGGANWQRTYSGEEAFCDVSQNALNFRTLYAVSYNGFGPYTDRGEAGVWKSTDFGNTWNRLNTPEIPPQGLLARMSVAVSPADTNVVYALASNTFSYSFQALWRSDDAGASWQTVADVDLGAPDVLGYFPWTEFQFFFGQGFYNINLSCDPVDPMKAYIGGIDLYMTKDGGETFNFVTYNVDPNKTPVHVDQHFQAFHPLTGDFYLCNDGGLYRTREIIPANDSLLYFTDCVDVANFDLFPCFELPTIFEYLDNGFTNTEFYRLGVDPSTPGRVAGGTQDNSGFLFEDNAWKSIGDADGFECIFHPNNPDVLFYSVYSGSMYISYDGGANFDPITDVPTSTDLGAWITPYQLLQQPPYTLYVGLSDVWKSEDNGQSWVEISNFIDQLGIQLGQIPLYALKVAPSNPAVIYAYKPVFDNGDPFSSTPHALLKTTDGGANWVDITAQLPALDRKSLLITMIEVKADDPNQVVVTLSGYNNGEKVYQSADGGQTWQNISGSLPNVPVFCAIYHNGTPNNGLYIGTEVGVFYRDDLSTDWEPYQTGMPATIVMDLDIQPKEQKLYAATYGRGIWSTATRETVGVFGPRKEAFEVSLSPNPLTQNLLRVQADGLANGYTLLRVFDALGREVFVQPENVTGRTLAVTLSLSALPSGSYAVQISDATGQGVVRSFVKQ
ncbi:MAG: T9SS type A sorting domain-containing protein [Saprospiraceae bacterium]|nr:T9SS type A sorting domain-containing protein [Saprospiraceae bacterium]